LRPDKNRCGGLNKNRQSQNYFGGRGNRKRGATWTKKRRVKSEFRTRDEEREKKGVPEGAAKERLPPMFRLYGGKCNFSATSPEIKEEGGAKTSSLRTENGDRGGRYDADQKETENFL